MEQTPNIRFVLDRMVLRLVEAYAPRRVLLFGSYADGAAHQDSDIDLLIIKDTLARPLDRAAAVRRILTGTHPAVPVDMLVLTPQEVEERVATGDQFVEEILRRGEELYAA